MAAEPALVSISEAATILGIARSTAYNLIKEGNFPVEIIVIGHSYKVSREKLMRLVRGDDETQPTARAIIS